jgi:hypothetical protein
LKDIEISQIIFYYGVWKFVQPNTSYLPIAMEILKLGTFPLQVSSKNFPHVFFRVAAQVASITFFLLKR